MQNRLRLVKGATALLYFGPLLAGLGGFGWEIMPLFGAIFVLWLFIMRPRLFPRTTADLKSVSSWVALAAPIVVQILLVTILFGVGRGIGGILGSLPEFSIMLPVAISFFSIPLARVFWDPWKADSPAAILDAALRRGSDAESQLEAHEMLQSINELPDSISNDDLMGPLEVLRDNLDTDVMFDMLLGMVRNGDASVAGRRALVLLGTDLTTIRLLDDRNIPTRVMEAVRDDIDLVRLAAQRLKHAVITDGTIRPQMPKAELLHQLAARHPDVAGHLNAIVG